MHNNRKKNQKKKRVILLSVITALVFVIALCTYEVAQSDWARQNIFKEQAQKNNKDTERPVNDVDYSGP
jgi:uncharacterized membrane protein YvbJ